MTYCKIPKDIEHILLSAIQGNKDGYITTNKTPNPFRSIGQNQRYATLSWGLFDEIHPKVDIIQYFNASLNTKTNKVIEFFPIDTTNNYKVDPVVFAWSVDPMAAKYPGISPYVAFADNPIYFVDNDGKRFKPANKADYEVLTNFFEKGFIDTKGNQVNAFELFGVAPAYFKQDNGTEIYIYKSNLSPDEFIDRLNDTKLSEEDKKYAQVIYDKLSSDDVYEIAVVSTQSEAVNFVDQNQTKEKEGGSNVKVHTDNPLSNKIFATLENKELYSSEKTSTIKELLGNKNYGYFSNENPETKVKGIIIIFQQSSSNDFTSSKGCGAKTDDNTNDLIKQGISNTPQ